MKNDNKDMNSLMQMAPSNNLLNDMQVIIESSRKTAHVVVNQLLVERNWLLGRRISAEELRGKNRAQYGEAVIKDLSASLTSLYGKGFTKTNLYSYLDFYNTYPEIFHSSSGKSVPLLSWTHFRTLLQVKDKVARDWYMNEAARESWNVVTLQRNISSQYYYRLLKSQQKDLVRDEMIRITAPMQQNQLEFIKNPVVAEFLGFSSETVYTESQFETAIISNLEKFLLELGKGYALVKRQKRIHTEKSDYYIDLVFYNYLLKAFVLIDLKTEKVTHQDVGQMDMYIRMYDEMVRGADDNPTIGILLCADTDDDIARYSVMHGNEQLFASKYLTYMPTKEQLRTEIEGQKQIFYLQQAESNKYKDNHSREIAKNEDESK